MKKHPYLKQAEKLLSPRFFVEFLDENIAAIAFEEGFEPFAHIVIEPSQFDGIILSWALDFNEVTLASDITINLMHCASLALGEVFYYSKSGNIYWNEQAEEQFGMEQDSDLLIDLVPPTVSVH